MIKKPKHLYKYLNFNENTLKLMCLQQAYYSDPAFFNDPLDCQPLIKNDLTLEELKSVFIDVMLRKSEKQFANSLKKLKFSKDKIEEKALGLADSEVRNALNRLEYDSTEYDVAERSSYLEYCYTQAIQKEIVNSFRTGVLCLSAKFDSPLMWSHYANQHKGLCIEYYMDNIADHKVNKVIYGGSRKILTSAVSDWLNAPESEQRIKQVCLLTKSEEWRYESEWRIFGAIGLGNSLPPIKAILFGLKCDDVTIYSVMKSMVTEQRKIKFWKMVNEGYGFDLKRKLINPDDYFNGMPYLYSDSDLAESLNDL